MVPDRNQILYACVSKGSTVLAEFSSGDPDLETLAVRCLEVSPRFHLLYSHTARSRIYAFLMADHPFLYFAVADEALGKPQCLLFLHRLCDAFSSSILKNHRINGSDHFTPRCFHDEFSPVLRRLVLPLPSQEDRSLPQSEPDFNKKEEQKKSKKKSKKKKRRRMDEEAITAIRDATVEDRVAIPVDDDDDLSLGIGGRKSARRMWGQHVRMILIIDLVVCSLLFGIWLSVCRGFQCIAG